MKYQVKIYVKKSGKKVGEIRDDVFYKNVNTKKHLMKVLDAWGIDNEIFESLLTRVKEIVIFDRDTKTTFRTTPTDMKKNGIYKEFKPYGKQIFLPIKFFKIDEK